MKSSALKRLIRKYTNHQASPVERYIIDTWYDSFDQDSEQTVWTKEQNRLTAIEDRIIGNALSTDRLIPWHQSTFNRIAAGILLFLSVSLTIYTIQNSDSSNPAQSIITFRTDKKQIKQILLSDSTAITLNANSTLVLLPDFGKAQRRVKLIGEAYFKVHKDKNRPFIIAASNLNIKVLGTSFNVQSYTHLKNIQVAVTSGKVGVSAHHKLFATLTPGQQIIYNKASGTFRSTTIDTTQHQLWVSGTVKLDRAGFDELTQQFLNIYGVNIRTTDVKVLKNEYNIIIRSTRTCQQTIEQLCTMMGKKYRKEVNGDLIIY